MFKNYAIENKTKSKVTAFDVHVHNRYEINFILSENVEVICQDSIFLSHPGDIFIFPPYIFHKVVARATPYKRFLCYFDLQEMLSASRLLKPALNLIKKNNKILAAHSENPQTLTDIFLSAENTQNDTKSILADFNNAAAFGKIIEYIAMHIDIQSPIPEHNIFVNEASQILRYLNEHLAEDITIDGTAKKFGMSRTSLYYIMRDSIGLSPKEYLSKIRIAKALELLQTDLSITDISEKCGFSNYSHFIRTFTKNIGVSPLKYKRNSGNTKFIK